MLLKFGEFIPDMPAYQNPGTSFVKNVIPMADGYEPFKGPSVFSDALAARCQGAASFRDADGTVFNFSGNAESLNKLTSTAWGDVSKAGGYTTGIDERWSFTQFGRNVIACNYTDPTQYFEMGTSTEFDDLAGSPPRARYVAAVKDFVVLANINDGDAYPSRVQWSPIGNPSGTWGTVPATQADYQDLDATNGLIRQIVGGEYGVVFQERAITRMTYVGSPLVFQFDEVESGRGTQAPGSVVKVGNTIFYLGPDGFYAFNGSGSIAIGDNKVDKTFLAALDANYLYLVQGVRDPRKPIVYWIYNASGSSGAPNAAIAYNWSTNRFSPIDLTGNELEFVYNAYVEGYTLDGLDAVSGSIDALDFSLDSDYWTGGTIQLAGFDASHRMVYLNGPNLEATLETSEQRPNEFGRMAVTRVRPAVDTASATVSVGTRETLSEAVTYTSAASQVSNGSCPVRVSGTYMRGRVSIPAGTDWTHAQGVELEEMQQTGRR